MWVTPTVSDIESRLATAELEAVRDVEVGTFQRNPIDDTIANAVAEVRSRISAHPRNPELGEEGTIPNALMAHFLALVRYRLLTRLPLASLVTEDRRNEYEDALKALEHVAEGRYYIDPPAIGTKKIFNGAYGSSPRIT